MVSVKDFGIWKAYSYSDLQEKKKKKRLLFGSTGNIFFMQG